MFSTIDFLDLGCVLIITLTKSIPVIITKFSFLLKFVLVLNSNTALFRTYQRGAAGVRHNPFNPKAYTLGAIIFYDYQVIGGGESIKILF